MKIVEQNSLDLISGGANLPSNLKKRVIDFGKQLVTNYLSKPKERPRTSSAPYSKHPASAPVGQRH